MAKDKKKTPPAGDSPAEERTTPEAGAAPLTEDVSEEVPPAGDGETAGPDAAELRTQLDAAKAAQASAEDRLIRLAAEYDNFRKRTAKEKDGIWNDATAAAVTALLPVFDNLERALKQETADAAYKKGVEMTMTGLRDAMTKLGVEEIPAQGETFDPNLHNAVMHCEDENAEENTIVEVFQQGFRLGDKVLRFAMVKVAN